jgi:NADH-quinone oxidoreductase subunit G
VEGIPKLQIACDTPVKDGMVVSTKSDRVKRAREGVMELLLVNHPLDCPICDQAGECKLQDYAYEYGMPRSRTKETRRAAKKRVDFGPTIMFDQERCILCRRCVRFCQEIPGTGEIGTFGRGDHTALDTFPGIELDNDYSMNVADICPVGALTTKDFRFKIRTWFLDEIPGVCTGCANGCNIYMGVANNKVYRYVPRRNDAVNDTWMCDAGRMSYKEIEAEDRLTGVSLRGESGALEPATLEEGIRVAAERLQRVADAHRGAGVIVGFASAHATNEDLFILKKLLSGLGTDAAAVPVVKGEADQLLVKAEKAANAAGARALGFADPASVLERVRGGGVDAAIVLGHDLLDEAFPVGTEALANLDTVILLDTRHSDLERVARVVFPTRHAAEKSGTLTNHAGRVQRIEQAVEPGFESYADGEILSRLGAALGLAGFEGGYDPRAVSREIAASVPAFAGIDMDSLSEEGAVLAGWSDQAES